MKKSNFARLLKLLKRYQFIIWSAVVIFIGSLVASLWIYYHLETLNPQQYWSELANFLMNVCQVVLGTILIGGGLGGIVNFIFEEQKREEEAVKERLASMLESRDRRRQFRKDMRDKLQKVYDDVSLARLLIQSHRSARTYGEIIREKIMPGDIALQELKRQLNELQEEAPIKHLVELQVSLTYMAAYLHVLIEEYAQHYLDISNLQNYQDVLASRRRTIFTEILEQTNGDNNKTATQKAFLAQTEELFQEHDVPNRMAVVWEAMERLDYVWDFIDDLRNEKGQASFYQKFFIDHHFHCLRLLKDKDTSVNQQLSRSTDFQHYIKEQERLIAKKNSDQPITKQDSLTRIIMKEGLEFDFEEMRRKP